MAKEVVKLDLVWSPARSSSTRSSSELRERSGPEGELLLKHVLHGEKETEDDSGISESSCEGSTLVATATSAGTEQAEEAERKESLMTVALQVFFPFLIAGFGTMLAGMLLDYVQVSRQEYTQHPAIVYLLLLFPLLLPPPPLPSTGPFLMM